MNSSIDSSRGDLRNQTKRFALSIVPIVEALPSSQITSVIGKQLLRPATSTGANYRSACRSRSRADIISKITVVEEEADETAYWLAMLHELHLINERQFEVLWKEANELTAIFVASSKTARTNSKGPGAMMR